MAMCNVAEASQNATQNRLFKFFLVLSVLTKAIKHECQSSLAGELYLPG